MHVFLPLLLLLLPGAAFAAPQTFADLVGRVVVIADLAVPIIVGLSLVIYLAGIAQGVAKAGDEKGRQEMIKNFYTWGLIILFVMVSIWGILRIMVDTFFSAEGTASQFESSTAADVDCAFNECF